MEKIIAVQVSEIQSELLLYCDIHKKERYKGLIGEFFDKPKNYKFIVEIYKTADDLFEDKEIKNEKMAEEVLREKFSHSGISLDLLKIFNINAKRKCVWDFINNNPKLSKKFKQMEIAYKKRYSHLNLNENDEEMKQRIKDLYSNMLGWGYDPNTKVRKMMEEFNSIFHNTKRQVLPKKEQIKKQIVEEEFEEIQKL